MDTPQNKRRITFFFPKEPGADPVERVYTLSKLKKLVPGSTFVGMLEDFPDVTEMPITNISLEQWDACLAAADGQTNFYSSNTAFFPDFHHLFGGGAFDMCWKKSLDKQGAFFSELQRASRSKEGSIVCLPEDVYISVTRDQAMAPNCIPFQAVTVNDHLYALCFDKGIPSKAEEGASITSLRNNMDGDLIRVGRCTHQPFYGSKYAPGSMPGPMGHAGENGPRGIPGACCTYYGKLFTPLAEGEVDKGECICGLSVAQFNQRNCLLELRRDLSSLDEVKFIKAFAQIKAAKGETRPTKRMPAFKHTRDPSVYARATEMFTPREWPHERAILTRIESEMRLMEVFVGVIFLK